MTILSSLPNFGWLTSELISRSSLILQNSLSVYCPSSINKSSTLSFVQNFYQSTIEPSYCFREYTYWTCTAIMILFGLKMLWESWRKVLVT
jgi:hypothetical protein